MRTFLLLCAVSLAAFADTKLGKPLQMKDSMAVGDLLKDPAKHVGQTVQVKGKVTAVCQMAGCWMALVDPASKKQIRVKVNDGDIVFPQTAVGKMAVAEGKFEKIELTREQAIANAKHEAEEDKRPFNPDSIKGPQVFYRIWGLGSVIFE